jgi:hypothetical protein
MIKGKLGAARRMVATHPGPGDPRPHACCLMVYPGSHGWEDDADLASQAPLRLSSIWTALTIEAGCKETRRRGVPLRIIVDPLFPLHTGRFTVARATHS